MDARRVRFSSLLDIDKITPEDQSAMGDYGFSSLLDIDKITLIAAAMYSVLCFSSLLDIDKITQGSPCGAQAKSRY